MIDIPIGKALVPIEVEDTFGVCRNCVLDDCKCMACTDEEREDCKNVIFKLVDWIEE